MADEGDIAQELNDAHTASVISAHRNRVRVLPVCEECEENRCFVTPQGTVTRICKPCWLERTALKS